MNCTTPWTSQRPRMGIRIAPMGYRIAKVTAITTPCAVRTVALTESPEDTPPLLVESESDEPPELLLSPEELRNGLASELMLACDMSMPKSKWSLCSVREAETLVDCSCPPDSHAAIQLLEPDVSMFLLQSPLHLTLATILPSLTPDPARSSTPLRSTCSGSNSPEAVRVLRVTLPEPSLYTRNISAPAMRLPRPRPTQEKEEGA